MYNITGHSASGNLVAPTIQQTCPYLVLPWFTFYFEITTTNVSLLFIGSDGCDNKKWKRVEETQFSGET